MSMTRMFTPIDQVFVRAWLDDRGTIMHWPTISMPLRVFSRVAVVQPVGSPGEWWLVSPRTLAGVWFADEDSAIVALCMGLEP